MASTLQVADVKRRSRRDDRHPFHFLKRGAFAPGPLGHVYGGVPLPDQGRDAADVIRVFVGQEQSVQPVQGQSRLPQPPVQAPPAEAEIDQNPGLRGRDVGAVSPRCHFRVHRVSCWSPGTSQRSPCAMSIECRDGVLRRLVESTSPV